MRVIKRLPLIEFARRHPRALVPLDEWHRLAEQATWEKFADVRRVFRHADTARVASGAVVCIFDIGGNKYRLVAKISYEKQKIYVLRVLTHAEYDTESWKAAL